MVLLYVVIGVVVIGFATTTVLVRSRRSRPSSTKTREPQQTRNLESTNKAGQLETIETAVDQEDQVQSITEVIEAPPSIAERLGRARAVFSDSLAAMWSRGTVDDAAFDSLEEALILADVGLPTTNRLLGAVREKVSKRAVLADPDALFGALREEIEALFEGDDLVLHDHGEDRKDDEKDLVSVWLFVGVNGVGKTTTIGKLAWTKSHEGMPVVLAAGDTFRAAAGEQLETWADRAGAGIVRGADGADPSSVVFDAVSHAAAQKVTLVLADTAGRLHTKVNLMDELRKIRRIADRPPGVVREVLLVLDATTGQNGLVQAREFTEAVEVTGIVLTKLDGTAKGGIVCAIRSELGIPIKLVGLGEHIGDLVAFDPEAFARALVG